MQASKNILSIIALCLIVWVLADALDIVGKVTQSITPPVETPTAPDLTPLVVIPPTSLPTPLPMPTPWTPEPTAPPVATEPAAATQLAVTQVGELEFVTASLRISEKVAADCLDKWVEDATAGRVPQSCTGILSQVSDLTIRHYELTQGGQ